MKRVITAKSGLALSMGVLVVVMLVGLASVTLATTGYGPYTVNWSNTSTAENKPGSIHWICTDTGQPGDIISATLHVKFEGDSAWYTFPGYFPSGESKSTIHFESYGASKVDSAYCTLYHQNEVGAASLSTFNLNISHWIAGTTTTTQATTTTVAEETSTTTAAESTTTTVAEETSTTTAAESTTTTAAEESSTTTGSESTSSTVGEETSTTGGGTTVSEIQTGFGGSAGLGTGIWALAALALALAGGLGWTALRPAVKRSK